MRGLARKDSMCMSAAMFAVAVAVLASTTASASAESLSLSIGSKSGLPGAPLPITAGGSADGAHRLYVYVARYQLTCAMDPLVESADGAHSLTSAEGQELNAGAFTVQFEYVPEGDGVFGVCAYLDEAPGVPPDAGAAASFSAPLEAPYLQAAAEELKRIAVEHEQQELQEQARRQQEREALERIPASELPQPEGPPPAHVASPPVVTCVVPSLKWHSLQAARRSLRHSHCALGRVERPRHVRSALVVRRQSAPHGAKLRNGAAVAVVLGPARH
ncbi:MAG TPA: hypothetical protein VN672_10525 [Solirubrobacteraceae bacterium]|nr:hypothetical protein [Solirubrobacteraceae bacterium]